MKSTYNQKTYILPMTEEIAWATTYIGYLTPFLSSTAIDLWERPLKQKIKEGVRVDIFVEQPEDWDWDLDPRDAVDRDWLKTNIRRLEQIGCHVTMVQYFHEKALIIDYQVLWSGSINFLSSNPEKRSEKVDRDDDFLAVTNAYFRFNFERCCVCEKIEWKKIRGAKTIDLKSLTAKSVSAAEAGGNNGTELTETVAKIVLFQQHLEHKKNGNTEVPANPELTPDIDEEPLGQWVRAIRKSLRISAAELARRANTTKTSIFSFEAGKTIPNLRLLVNVLDKLGYELMIVPKHTEAIHRRISKGFTKSEIAKAILETAAEPSRRTRKDSVDIKH